MANQTLNPFTTTPKETKKPIRQIGGSWEWDERESNLEDPETSRFINQENFVIEPAAVVAEAAQTKPASEPNVIYGEYQGSGTIQGNAGTLIELTRELKIDTTEQREIEISANDQKEVLDILRSAGADTLKDAAKKTASTITDVGATTAKVIKDTVIKDTLGFGVKKEKPMTPEEIEKANKAAEQRAHEQKFQAELTIPHPKPSVFELDNKVVSSEHLEAALRVRLTGDHIDEKGKLKAGKAAEAEKALKDQAKLQEKAAQRANTLAMATTGKGLGKGELDKGTENPNHFTKATG